MIGVFFFSVIISVMTFEGTDCCLADIGRLADSTGGRVRVPSSLYTGDEAATRCHHLANILTIAALVCLNKPLAPYTCKTGQLSNGLLLSHVQVNTVSVGTVASEIQLASLDNVLATNVTATLLAAKGV